MAATRLRKSFKYPTDDSDDDSLPRDMDEEGNVESFGMLTCPFD